TPLGRPLAPPVPLPLPGPVGMSNPPDCAMFTALVCVVFVAIPLGSPKPPVCTCGDGRSVVWGAELPVEKTLVLTACLGTTGAVDGGIGSNFLAAILTSGARASSTFGLGWG